MTEFRSFRRPLAGCLALAAVLAGATAALAQTPFWQPQQNPPQQQTPATPVPGAPVRRPATTPAARPAVPATTSAVVARIDGKALTQADFDRVAVPYFGRMRAQFGSGFEGDIVKIANHNVLDELFRRELLRIEARRQKIVPSQADIDSVLSRDPYFYTDGRFDATKFNMYKTGPQSNYLQMLPELTELAAMDVLDRRLRQRMTPTAAELRAEWGKRNDQVKFHSFAVLQRDISLDPESTAPEWQAYYDAHPDQFMRRTRVRLRYARFPIPAEGDSSRGEEEKKATAHAKALLDSIEHKTLPDTSARLQDTGLFEALSGNVPGLGFVTALQSEVGRADSVASVRRIGPVTTPDAVIAGVVTEREPKHLPPLREVLGDVRRAADVEKRRTVAEDERRAFYTVHADRFRTTRMAVTRVTLADAAFQTRPATKADMDKWYAENWRRFMNVRDTTRRTPPPVPDSLKTALKLRTEQALRPVQIDELMNRLAAAMKANKDFRGAARAANAVAETLTMVKDLTGDTLFVNPMAENYYRTASAHIGEVQGPQVFAGYYVVWRIESIDSTWLPPFDMARAKADVAYREDQRAKDEAEGRAFFVSHRTQFKAPTKYAVDAIRFKLTPPDSVKITDAELRANYDRNKDRFRQEEEVHARHILIMSRDAGEADDRKAKQRADSLLVAVKGGADFIDLAKRFSQEPGAASSGGDLGWFGRGRMVKEFETAAFAMQPGQTSEVVKTQFGYHIIKLEERKPAGVRPFDDVRGELRTEMAQARSDTSAKRAAQALRRKLAAGGDATALAKPYGGLVAAAPIAPNEPLPDVGFLQGLGADLPKMLPGRWSATVYRAADQYVLVRLRSRTPPRPAEFDEVKAQVIDDMKAQRKKDLMVAKVAAIRAALAAGASPDSVAAPWGGLKEANPVTANAAFVPTLGFGPHIMPKILKLKKGELSDTLSTPIGVMWARMDERIPADATQFRTQKDQVQQEMVVNRMNDWLEAEKKTVRIEVLRADLREPKPGPYKTVTIGGGGG